MHEDTVAVTARDRRAMDITFPGASSTAAEGAGGPAEMGEAAGTSDEQVPLMDIASDELIQFASDAEQHGDNQVV